MGQSDLYSESATRHIQRLAYGYALPAGQDQQGFAYPGLLVPIILPFCLLNDVEVATSIWTGFSFLLLLTALHGLCTPRREARLPDVLLLSLWPYTVLSLVQGQVSVLVLASLAAGYSQAVRGRELRAGLALSVSLVKPELVILPLASLIATAPRQGRTRLLAGLAGGVFCLLAASILLIGWWIPDWIAALARYVDYAQVAWVAAESRHLHPLAPALIVGVIAAACVVVRRRRDMLFALSVPAQLLLFPQTLIWAMTLLTVPLAVVFQGKSRCFFHCLWGLGWYCLLFHSSVVGWKLQMGGFCLVCVVAIGCMGVAVGVFRDL